MERFAAYDQPAMTEQEAAFFLQSTRARLNQGVPVTITEYQLNSYLNSAIMMEHSLALKPWVKPTGIYCDLSPDTADICIERTIKGRIHQSQITIKSSTDKKAREGYLSVKTKITPTGGMIGKLKLPTKAALALNPWYQDLVELTHPLRNELRLHHCEVTIAEDQLTITPLYRGAE